MNKILILGAGIYQVPLIKKAKQMGLYTIVASYQGAYPGLALADEIWDVDTRDVDTLLILSKKADINGVVTAGTDVAVGSLGIICETLNLNGLSSKSANTVTDKALMKEVFVEGQVRTPRADKAYSLDEAREAFAKIDKAVLVKAVDSSGSRGITRVEQFADIDLAYQEALAVSKKDYVLVEELVDGHEIGVDGFISHGKIQFMLPHDKFTHTVGGVTIPAGHVFPFDCTPKLEAEIQDQIKRAIKATGLDNCAINADVMLFGDKAYILEIGGRSGATCIPELISIYGDFDYYQQMILNALGEVPEVSLSRQCDPLSTIKGSRTACMAKLIFSDVGGVLTAIDEGVIDKLRSNDVQISLDFALGDKVEAVKDGTSRIGQVIMRTNDVKALDDIILKVRGAIKIDEKD